jgi:hypothetical protein
MKELRMKKVVKIVSLKEQKSDFEYWKNKSDIERLEAIEFLRQQYFALHKDVPKRFTRVCRIINKTQS